MKEKAILGILNSRNRVFIMSMVAMTAFILMSFTAAPNTGLALDNSTIKGTVTDAYSKKPLAGVTVQIKGTDIQVVTKKNGKYKISTTDDSQKLVVSCIGYQSLEIEIAERTEIDVAISLIYSDPDVW